MAKVDLESVRGPVALLQYVKSQQRKLKEIEDKAKAAVQDVMGNADTGTLDGEVVITWDGYKKRQFDQKTLQDEKPEVAAEYTKMISVRTFRVVE